MSIRSKRLMLLATVVLPTLAGSLIAPPTLAETLNAPILLAQDTNNQPSDELNLQLQQEEELRRAQEEARRLSEEQQRASEEENRRLAEEQQRAAQEEADRQAQEQQRAAEQAQRDAAEQQRAAEQQQAKEAELRNQAEQALKEAEQQQRVAEEEMRRRADEAQQAAQQESERQARELEKAAEEAKRQAAQQQTDEEQQRAIEEEAAAQEAEQKRAIETPAAPVDTQPVPPAPEPSALTPAVETAPKQPDTLPPVPHPAPESQSQNEATPPQPATNLPSEQPTEVPRVEQLPTAPSQAITDERTETENLEIAKDPSKTNETVVLPVENGAAILDSDKDADNRGGKQSREDRRKQREQQRAAEENVAQPTDDANAQVAIPEAIKAELPKRMEANLKEKGVRLEQAPVFALPETTNVINNNVINNTVVNNTTVNNINNNVTNVKVIEQIDNRVIFDVGDRIVLRGDDRPRLRRDAVRSFYDELPGGRMRETIVRPDGYEIVTVYDRYGDIRQRTRIDRDGNEYPMIYAPEYDDGPRADMIDIGYELPPMRLTVPIRDYIIDVADDPERDFYDFLALPPVERVERVYTINEVRHSARLRDKVRRIDLDTIHFSTGSAEVSLSQAKTLRKVADAMHRVLQKDPGETFFIEGHTDAIGSDMSNLVLSDKRAESVASLLTEVYDIPAENLVTQGYGERFLKIRTQAAEQENRRVTIRRVTPLVRPVAQR